MMTHAALTNIATASTSILRFMCLLLVAPFAWATPLTVTDSQGHTVTLAAPAQRIITLAPHAAELVFAAGAGSALIAVSDHSDAPAAVKTLPVIGNTQAMDLERIAALKPDLIIAPLYLSQRYSTFFKDQHIALYIADAPTPIAIANDIEALGVLSDHGTEARTAAQRYRQRLAGATAAATTARAGSSHQPPAVFYQLWEPPLYTVGNGSLIDQAIGQCGGRNVFAALQAPSPVVSLEAVLSAQPQVIVMGASLDDFERWKKNWLRWPNLPAVRDNALIRIDPDLLHRPGPRFAEGVEQLCKVLRDHAIAPTHIHVQ